MAHNTPDEALVPDLRRKRRNELFALGAVPQTVGDQQRHHRTRQQRQRDAGGDKGEIGLKGHGELRRASDLVIMHGGAENSS